MASGHRVPLLLQRMPSTKVYPKKPSIIIPPTPITNTFHNDSTVVESEQLLSTHLSRASFTTLVSSPSPSPLPHVIMPKSFSIDPPKPIAAESILCPDIMAVAELFSTMKHTLNQMNQTFEALEEQAQKMVCVSADIQASEQLKQLHDELEQQIARQHAEMQRVRLLLEDKVKEALEHRLKAQAYEMIKNTISQQIGHKIRSEMSCQIPSKLSHTSKARRPVLEIKTNFDKNEPRHTLMTEPINLAVPARPLLRPLPTPEQSPIPSKPLLRPLPTPEQSPIYGPPPTALPLTSRYTSPLTAYPRVPVATPVSGSFSAPLSRGMHVLDTIPENPSSCELPCDLRSLFSLHRVKKPLFRDFSMFSNDDSTNSSPSSDMSPLTPMPVVIPPPEIAKAPLRDSYVQENPSSGMFNINDDEVPYLMIPPPKPRGDYFCSGK